jgi:hypothetical protein
MKIVLQPAFFRAEKLSLIADRRREMRDSKFKKALGPVAR